MKPITYFPKLRAIYVHYQEFDIRVCQIATIYIAPCNAERGGGGIAILIGALQNCVKQETYF